MECLKALVAVATALSLLGLICFGIWTSFRGPSK